MHQNPISAGALPKPCWESLQRSKLKSDTVVLHAYSSPCP